MPDHLKCLAVNTATTVLSLALVEGDKTLHTFAMPETRDQGNLLLGHIRSALTACGLDYADLDLLAAVTGPGSFTGIRIGLAAMRGMALAAGKPLLGFSSFDMFAARVPDALNVVAVESWREELYFAVLDEEGHPMMECLNESPEIFAKIFRHNFPGAQQIAVSGDAAAKAAPFLPAASRLVQEPASALSIARLAQRQYNPGETPPRPAPYYLRAADITLLAQPPRTLGET